MIIQSALGAKEIQQRIDGGPAIENWQFDNDEFSSLRFNNKSLRGLVFQQIHCPDFYLEESLLEGSEVVRASLPGSVYSLSRCSHVNWLSSLLKNSSWTDMALESTRFEAVYAPKSQWRQVSFKNCVFRENEWHYSRFDRITGLDLVLSAVHPSGITGFQHSVISNSLFMGCHFEGRILEMVHLNNCCFLNCSFRCKDFSLTRFEACTLFDCSGLPDSMNRPLQLNEVRDLGQSWEQFELEVFNGTS